jgi:hypothetical protein
MDDNVIGVTFQRKIRKFLLYPFVEYDVKKDVGQQRTDPPLTDSIGIVLTPKGAYRVPLCGIRK